VTSANDYAARNFGHASLPPHALRYEKASEFVDVVNALWNSWDDDAFILDRTSGLFFDPTRQHAVHHEGKFFKVDGALNIARSPQGHPVIIQAGASDTGLELAARTAELVFASASNPQDAKRGYDDLKGRMAKYGRPPDSLKILAGLPVVIGQSQQEAEDKAQALQEMIHPDVGRFRLGTDLEADLSDLPLDEPIPESRLPKSANPSQGVLRRHHEDHPRREPDLAAALSALRAGVADHKGHAHADRRRDRAMGHHGRDGRLHDAVCDPAGRIAGLREASGSGTAATRAVSHRIRGRHPARPSRTAAAPPIRTRPFAQRTLP